MLVVEGDGYGRKELVTIYGNSADTKPTDKEDGSVFIETNTLDVYMWDATNEVWRKM